MKKSLRLSEVWFRRSLWLVALLFAFFLIGLASTVIGDLPKVERDIEPLQFVDKNKYHQLEQQLAQFETQQTTIQQKQQQLELELTTAQNDVKTAENSFNDWLQTRTATERDEQNPEVIKRTQQLEPLRQKVRKVESDIEQQNKLQLDADTAVQAANAEKQALLDNAQPQVEKAINRQETKVFLYRLGLTLPLVLLAGWLWKNKRRSTYWPFVWGFIFFALFTFFVELVPYLPSYGGYVRYVVGIIITLVVGQQVIVALNRYLEQQKQAEALPEQLRRQELSYDVAFKRLTAGVCPGCERSVNLSDPTLDYCPHCGICLHNHCNVCDARKITFMHFCQVCGTPSEALSNSSH